MFLKPTRGHHHGTSLMVQMIKKKNLPAMQETQVQPLDQEDPLEKGMATLSSTSLENPRDKGAWRATVCGVAKSWTRLSKRLYYPLCLVIRRRLCEKSKQKELITIISSKILS